MSVYVRRFLSDPGDTVLLNIESVNVLDLTPPQEVQGVGSGTVLLVGEFENGPFNVTQQIASATDLQNEYGTLGYTYTGIICNHPCAVQRSADAAVTPENWNGNGFLALNGKQFGNLLLCRVDTSVGLVQFTRLAYIEGAAAFSYALTTGAVLALDIGAGPVLATFTGAAASVVSGAGTYSGLVAGDTAVLGADGNANVTVVFQSTDTSQAAVITRINQYAGYNMAGEVVGSVSVGAGGTGYTGTPTVTFSAPQNPNGRTALGTVTASSGVVTAITVTDPGSGYTTAPTVTVVGAGTGATCTATLSATKISLVGNIQGTSGQVRVVSGSALASGKLNLTVANTAGSGNVGNIAAVLTTEVETVVAGAVTGTLVEINSAGALRISNVATPSTGSITVGTATTATALGFVAGQTNSAATGNAGTIPAGTVVQDTGATHVFVTMQDINVTATGAGPYPVKIRHAQDDGTGLAASPGVLTVVLNPPNLGAFAAVNLAATTAALTETQIDAAYVNAINTTTDVNTIAKTTNLIYAARHSNTVRKALRTNAITASAGGCYGRMACVSPPLNTSPTTALSTTADPGVGAYRDQRTIYCYIGANVFVPLIGMKGVAGGNGFNATGNIDQVSDGWMASICSQLPPEENPGQDTPFTSAINSIETGANVQGLTINNYIAFKAAGIAALRFDTDSGIAIFQSGVTSVDPLVYPSLVRIARRRMADFIQDSLAIAMQSFGKKLSTNVRRNAMVAETRSFLIGLLGVNNPGSQRIAGFTVDTKSNTTQSLASGLFKITVNVQTLSSLDSIVLVTTIGDDVAITETLPAAA